MINAGINRIFRLQALRPAIPAIAGYPSAFPLCFERILCGGINRWFHLNSIKNIKLKLSQCTYKITYFSLCPYLAISSFVACSDYGISCRSCPSSSTLHTCSRCLRWLEIRSLSSGHTMTSSVWTKNVLPSLLIHRGWFAVLCTFGIKQLCVHCELGWRPQSPPIPQPQQRGLQDGMSWTEGFWDFYKF